MFFGLVVLLLTTEIIGSGRVPVTATPRGFVGLKLKKETWKDWTFQVPGYQFS